MRREIFVNILLIISLTACAKSNKNGGEQSNRHNNIMTSCEVHNEEYGTISCDQIPLSIKAEVNNKFNSMCYFEFYRLNNSDFECLEKNKLNPSDGYALGYYKYNGIKTALDKNGGLNLIKQSAKNKYPEALAWMSVYYAEEGDSITAFELRKQAADLGYPLAMYGLGFYYSRGIGTGVNEELALEWLNQSKEYIPAAYSEIGLIYFKYGDIKKFINYSEVARKRKYWEASVDLAILYLGEVPNYKSYADPVKAMNISEELILNKFPAGSFFKAKALILKNGKGNNEEICKLYEKSYRDGYINAGVSLAGEYIEGMNCEKDYKKGLDVLSKLYSNTTGESKVIAANNLGYMYLNGLGVKKDKELAKQYLIFSAQAGNQSAKDLLKSIEH